MSRLEVVAWATDGEKPAGVDALARLFERSYPGHTVVNPVVDGTLGAHPERALRTRLRNNEPPDVLQVHPGAELAEYVRAGQLTGLDDHIERWGLRRNMPAGLLDAVTVNGTVYAVPVGIHRLLLWSNDDVCRRAGLTSRPAVVDDLLDHLELLRRAGVEYPLALGTYWTQFELLEAVLLAELGPDRLEALWAAPGTASESALTRAIERYAALVSYSNPDRDGLHWTALAERMRRGRAAYLFMGDWVIGDLEGNGRHEHSPQPFPGTEATFQWLGDAFVLPRGAANEKGALGWLRTVAGVEGQQSFCASKGAAPAHTDVDTAGYSAYQRSAIADLARLRLVRSGAHGLASEPARTAAITAAVAEFSSGGGVAGLREALQSAEDCLRSGVCCHGESPRLGCSQTS